jgi:hypothetical protein
MKDKKGYMPAHVAVPTVGNWSPKELQMRLSVNPSAVYEQTNENETLLELATNTAYELNHQLGIFKATATPKFGVIGRVFLRAT